MAKFKPELVKEFVEDLLRNVKSNSELMDKLRFYEIPLSVAAKFKPELVKEWLDHEIKEKGLDPRELLEQEKGLLEREFLEEFLKQHGYLKEVEEKAEEIKEELEKTEEKVGEERGKLEVPNSPQRPSSTSSLSSRPSSSQTTPRRPERRPSRSSPRQLRNSQGKIPAPRTSSSSASTLTPLSW